MHGTHLFQIIVRTNIHSLCIFGNPLSEKGFIGISNALQDKNSKLMRLHVDVPANRDLRTLLFNGMSNSKLIEFGGISCWDLDCTYDGKTSKYKEFTAMFTLFRNRNNFFIDLLGSYFADDLACIIIGYVFRQFLPGTKRKRRCACTGPSKRTRLLK